MKKCISLLLALVMAVSCFAGFSKEKEQGSKLIGV